MTEYAYAKINLNLFCMGKRPDGYHDLKTVMHTVSLCDRVDCEKICGLSVNCSDPDIPSGRDNIAYKCAVAFMETFRTGGADIYIVKNIPSRAGLGGGSADGAAVIRAMAKLYGIDDRDALIRVAARCGADVPFCLAGGCALCEGTGDVMTPLPTLSGNVVIAKGAEGISTPEAYRLIDTVPPFDMNDTDSLPHYSGIPLYNDFERVCSLSDAAYIKSVLGEERSLMTGSGSAVFGLIPEKNEAERLAEALREKGYFAGVYEFTGGLM